MDPVGLIAARGEFPHHLARAARRHGRSVVAVALRDLADPGLVSEVDTLETLAIGQVGALFDVFRKAGVRDVVLAGKVPKTELFGDLGRLELDDHALRIVASLADRKDDSFLGAVASLLHEQGFRLLEQLALAPDLCAEPGVLGAQAPSAEQLADVAFGWPLAKMLGRHDVGQTAVVGGLAALALEAVEGTDAAIRRGCALGAPGACVVKVSKPSQDPRFDVPAVGLDTMRTLIECHASVLAVEAGHTILLQREEVIAEADAAGVVVLGVDAERLPWENPS